MQRNAEASANQIASLALPEGQWRGAKPFVPCPARAVAGQKAFGLARALPWSDLFQKRQTHRLPCLLSLSPSPRPPSLPKGGERRREDARLVVLVVCFGTNQNSFFLLALRRYLKAWLAASSVSIPYRSRWFLNIQ